MHRILAVHTHILTVVAAFLISALVAPVGQAETLNVQVQGQPANPPAVRDVRYRRVGPQLTALHEKFVIHQLSKSAQAFQSDVPSLRVKNEMVSIDTAADGDPAQLVAALEKLGAIDVVAFKRVVSARLPVASIPELADIEWLRFARPVMATTYIGATTSQGDAAMKTDDARTNFGVDGSGVTVGVLSDSFDTGPGSYVTDVASLDLPVGIEVLDDLVVGSDEGRAMLQLIYDVVPGADLSFHTAFSGQAAFALGIQELSGCPAGSEPGCVAANDPAEVIVDDVGYFATPMFQDGIIAQAVDVVHDAGVPYFSSAGNSARSSWEGGPFNSSGISPPGYDDEGGAGDAHDFDPGEGEDIFQKVLFPAGTTNLSFQWDQPFFSASGAPGSANDIDICVYTEPPGDVPVGCSVYGNVGADPVELISLTEGGAANIVIIKYLPEGGPDPAFMKYVVFSSGFSVTDPYPDSTASTTFGQNNAAGAIAVGAAFYFNTPVFGTDPALLESFSSAGGTPILFDTFGTALATPEVRARPQIVAPDGTNTTFFGSDDNSSSGCCERDGFPNFFGTSAAAPHAAALAALMLEAFPGLTPNGVEDVLTSSAHDMGAAGFDFDSGYGLVDGNTAVASVDASTNCDGVATLALSGTPSSAAGTFSATTSISYQDGSFENFDAYAPRHVFKAGTTINGPTSFSTNCVP
jgi:hypothetical protein